ncbi:hypothetical protein HYW99_02570 [Candidatus Woesearchaeota archaeon]|nr:hypothetical protein [Candidatus Woesearchaeota archaeon]MBI3026507.1 hypothetical protein [Candidatus Woesearchaeota archaeon]
MVETTLYHHQYAEQVSARGLMGVREIILPYAGREVLIRPCDNGDAEVVGFVIPDHL